MTYKEKLKKISENEWILDKKYRENARVDSKIIANESVLKNLEDEAIEQLTNVACLPGIIEPVIGLSDMHWGYGLPMGAVGAFDAEEGVISAGCTGFDINCLSKDSRILHKFGYTKKIKDFEDCWHKEKIICVNPSEKVKDTKIDAFMCFKPKKRVFEVKTQSGQSIVATEDHPFFTQEGMKELKEIQENKDRLSVFPFNGVEYQIPTKDIIISEKDIGKKEHIKELKKRGLLPLMQNNPKLPLLIKIFGFVLGDGCAYSSKKRSFVCFYGKRDDLESIRNDVSELGFIPSKIFSRMRKHKINTFYDEVNFEREEESFRTNSNSFFYLLKALKLPTGNKTRREFDVPRWILNAPKWQKRLFLASFFGAELSSPKTVTDHDYNFYGPVLSMDKIYDLKENGKKFLRQISYLLKEFDVKSKLISERKEYLLKDGKFSYRLRLQISSSPNNLINLWSRIGYEYNVERRFLGNVASHYLKFKNNVIKERKKAEKIALALKMKGNKFSKISSFLKSKYINERFLKRSIYEGRKGEPRISSNFMKFGKFLREFTKGLGRTGQCWDYIKYKKEINYSDFVYDFSVADENHNFIANNFIVSNCGINMIRTNLGEEEIKPKLKELMDELFRRIPCGVGSKGKLRLSKEELDKVLIEGVDWAIKNGYGVKEDKENMEEKGKIDGADVTKVSDLAKKRGLSQLGTLGAGNHFLEVQKVSHIYDKEKAKKYGVTKEGQITIMIHCGSRGLGHQIATDYLQIHEKAAEKYNIKLPDKQLVCAPVNSSEGQDYFKAMKCAVNYAFCNRLVMTHWIREAFENVFKKSWQDMDIHTIYSVCHNICKYEKHYIPGTKRKENMYIHRKGATRSFPDTPVLIAGTMGTASYLLEGTEKAERETFGSSCHGAGRAMSRNAAIKQFKGSEIKHELEKEGKQIRATSYEVLAEESPSAYKDVDSVIESVVGAGINIKIARMIPLGVAKG